MFQKADNTFGKYGRAYLIAVFDESEVQVSHIVINGTSTGITACQPDSFLPGIFDIRFCPDILVFADNDSRFILPQHEDIF